MPIVAIFCKGFPLHSPKSKVDEKVGLHARWSEHDSLLRSP